MEPPPLEVFKKKLDMSFTHIQIVHFCRKKKYRPILLLKAWDKEYWTLILKITQTHKPKPNTCPQQKKKKALETIVQQFLYQTLGFFKAENDFWEDLWLIWIYHQ